MAITKPKLLQIAALFVWVLLPSATNGGEITDLKAKDVPNDRGGAVSVSWKEAEPLADRLEVLRYRMSDSTDEPEAVVLGELPGGSISFDDCGDNPLQDGEVYRYAVKTHESNGEAILSPLSETVVPEASWIHAGRISNLVCVFIFAGMFFLLVARAKRGKEMFIRPIDALDTMDDAVGRAAEMGRPVFYAPGLHSITQPATVASMSILSRVAQRSAMLHTKIKVPNFDPLTWPVAQEVVRQGFVKAGREKEFDADDVSYLTSRSFTYAAAVAGIMVRDRTATNFLIGHFFSESLILAETGAATGAYQIGGTESVAQLPFFITTCDKTMIGEELFAAAALVGDDPVSRSTIKAHDWFKVLLMIFILLGAGAGLLIQTGVLDSWFSSIGLADPSEVYAKVIDIVRGGG